MKIVIQSLHTQAFLGHDDHWHHDSQEARGFTTANGCIDHCLRLKIRDYQVLFMFADLKFNIAHAVHPA